MLTISLLSLINLPTEELIIFQTLRESSFCLVTKSLKYVTLAALIVAFSLLL